MLSLNKKVDKQNSHSNVEQNHHDNQDRAVGLRGRKREREKRGECQYETHTHTLTKLTHEAVFIPFYLFNQSTTANTLITTVGH